ncbi:MULTISPECIES: flagellar filament capping protein FliD [Pseudomonas]|uniref:Flagellar hook-associated protein 2 n=1 Tax=Pseudomonas donghuensis TaxID=1163398 RepID=A0AAP0SLI7_9PSED|nr:MULTISPECIES: flagellar filament capping protein FliD [Pseudomonas]MDF9892441.1 flagellar hook-associated protein 2 [Pseudomonas vranovensis]KDO01003.1 flagellar filament capping protein FliD [Pseudomonas donghuensis]MBS7600092.1 flagellar filament capping protein FliD [Pseudomonas sp. RC2C2]MCP6692081.1 flagellar filament capping protein FliD [Pseudomonas donghuensis]MCP6695744.1 flagellar filament capping protein FliD [Pseudomonas donghuensis]
MASTILPSVGLGSGVDINKIVDVLVKAETNPKANQIKRQTANNTAMLSGVASLKSALSVYQEAMKKLNDPKAPSFNAYTATSSSDATVKATSNNTAVPGTYSVLVEKLATSSKVASQNFTGGASTSIPEGDLTITQDGVIHTVKVGPGATLQTVRDSINTSLAEKGISANIVNGKDGSRLVFSSTKTGEGTDISVDGIAELKIDGTVSMASNGAGYIDGVAQSAKLTIDGLPVTSKTNTVDGAISGISLELLQVTGLDKDKAIKVTVGENTEGLKTSVKAFVDAYNTLVKAANALSAVSKDADGKTVLGPLTSDPTTRSLLSELRKQLSTPSGSGRLTTLSQLGINTAKDGTLEFNSTKYDAAMKDKKLGPDVQELFTGTNGVFANMTKAVEPYLQTGGILDSRKAGLDKLQKDLSDQQLALDRRITSLTESLTKRYVAMDTLVGKLEAQRKNIASMFASIEAQQKNS